MKANYDIHIYQNENSLTVSYLIFYLFSSLKILVNTSISASILLLLMTTMDASAQSNKAYIYGSITTKSDDRFEGFMRWGKEEMFWHDLFNSEKIQSEQKRVNRSSESESIWDRFEWNISRIWDNKYSDVTHLFACLFGDIKSLEIGRGDLVFLEMKNGNQLRLNGGSNDIGATVHLHDYELGKISFDWKRIDRIDFFQAPEGATPPFGKPLYGEVKTRRNGNFTGYIKWDLDERCGDDILDGDTDFGDQKFEFKNIVQIEKDGIGSTVIFNSGRKLFLDGSNDVNSGNRGIAVYDHNIGNIEIPWKQFESVEFIDDNQSGPGYHDFTTPKSLEATITTFDDKQLEGMIIYDIDEMWEMETLEGKDNDLEYQIPFRNIKRLTPKNSSYSLVHLCIGEELLLGDLQDVSARNDGILLFAKGEKDPIHIDWDDIDEILFKE